MKHEIIEQVRAMRMKDPREAGSKDEAVAFVDAVIRISPALASPDFQVAMELSERFDIRARDLLEYRREQARRA